MVQIAANWCHQLSCTSRSEDNIFIVTHFQACRWQHLPYIYAPLGKSYSPVSPQVAALLYIHMHRWSTEIQRISMHESVLEHMYGSYLQGLHRVCYLSNQLVPEDSKKSLSFLKTIIGAAQQDPEKVMVTNLWRRVTDTSPGFSEWSRPSPEQRGSPAMSKPIENAFTTGKSYKKRCKSPIPRSQPCAPMASHRRRQHFQKGDRLQYQKGTPGKQCPRAQNKNG